MSNMYPYPWPIGTCHFNELPPEIQTELMTHVHDGEVDNDIVIHQTPTEGQYISFAGWKVRVIFKTNSRTVWITTLA